MMPSLAQTLREHRRAFALAGVALALAGVWLAASAYSEPRETRALVREAGWTERASYAYLVPITRNSTHYAVGSVLGMGEPAYFRTVSDSILVDLTWDAEADDIRGVAAGRMVVDVRAQSPDGRLYWSIEHTLAEATARQIGDGLALSGRLDLDALAAEVDSVSKELPLGDGVINWTIRTSVAYAIEANGRHETGEHAFVLPIVANDPRYVLPRAEALVWAEEHAPERAVVSQHAAGVPGVLASGKALALLGFGIAALLVAAWAGPSDETAAFERELRRYRDFVSVAGNVPPTVGTLVEVASLQDLVHVATDARTRVLLDSTTKEFFALLPGVTYRYGKHASKND